ncbi:hypothetical protein J6590_055108 [Homalodisca vitripennis]|nr:hypothetical protein J6590_055108 [Homalodisca vitripennis]
MNASRVVDFAKAQPINIIDRKLHLLAGDGKVVHMDFSFRLPIETLNLKRVRGAGKSSALWFYCAAESDEDVAAGVLSFNSGGVGHKLAEACVTELRRDFRGYDWGHNGPGIITKVLKSTCGTENVREMTPKRCQGFRVFPPHIFYPIPWRKWRLYFDTQQSEETLHRLARSRAIHVWNKFSTQANITVGSKQPYAVIASKYCPRVYANVGAFF